MRKLACSLALVLIGLNMHAQFSVSVGPSMIKSFGIRGVYPGFHISGEYSKDDQSTLIGRIGFYPGKKGEDIDGFAVTQGKDYSVSPYSYSLKAKEKFNYTVIEVGRRYYFGNGFDNGFGFYGGSNICLIFNKVKFDVEDYDETKYDLLLGAETVSDRDRIFGSIFGLSFGLNAGIKHSFYFGTFFLDGGLAYALLAQPSNSIAASTSMHQSLIFNFNLGIRKDFY